MCSHGNTVDVRVLVPAHLAFEEQDTWKTKPIDRCLAPLVDAFNKAGVVTLGSCCGHGKGRSEILLGDGRTLVVETAP